MSNETKRDVFEKALREWDDLVHSCGLQGEETHGGCEFDPVLIKYEKDYDAALPDDMPVIPKAIGEYITSCKARMMDLHDSTFNWLRSEEEDEFMECYSETFARAWVLGVWRVEETGEIVKLEEEE